MGENEGTKDMAACSKVTAPTPIFVVGVGRSGTTLLMAMLDAHPEIAFPPETHFLRTLVVSNKAVNRSDAIKMLEAHPFVSRVGIDSAALASGFPENHRARNWHQAYRVLLDLVRLRSGKKLVGDKDPKNIEYLPLIKAVYSDARILHIVRDPRDVLLSRMKADWSKERPILHHVLAYRAQLRMGRYDGSRLFGDRYMEIQYEKLIAEPETTLQRICAFLGVSYKPQMLEFHKSAAHLVSGDEAQWKQNVTKPLLTANSGRWRQTLTRVRILQAERLCGDVFEPHGPYERSITRLRYRELLCVSLLVLVGAMLTWVYRCRQRFRNRRSIARLVS